MPTFPLGACSPLLPSSLLILTRKCLWFPSPIKARVAYLINKLWITVWLMQRIISDVGNEQRQTHTWPGISWAAQQMMQKCNSWHWKQQATVTKMTWSGRVWWFHGSVLLPPHIQNIWILILQMDLSFLEWISVGEGPKKETLFSQKIY